MAAPGLRPYIIRQYQSSGVTKDRTFIDGQLNNGKKIPIIVRSSQHLTAHDVRVLLGEQFGPLMCEIGNEEGSQTEWNCTIRLPNDNEHSDVPHTGQLEAVRCEKATPGDWSTEMQMRLLELENVLPDDPIFIDVDHPEWTDFGIRNTRNVRRDDMKGIAGEYVGFRFLEQYMPNYGRDVISQSYDEVTWLKPPLSKEPGMTYHRLLVSNTDTDSHVLETDMVYKVPDGYLLVDTTISNNKQLQSQKTSQVIEQLSQMIEVKLHWLNVKFITDRKSAITNVYHNLSSLRLNTRLDFTEVAKMLRRSLSYT